MQHIVGILAVVLMAIGGIIAVIGAFMLIMAAFRESVLWGLGTIFVPFVALFFLFMHWNEARRPFLIKISGIVVALGGAAIGAFFGK